jgi:hypothetical protein
MAMVKESRNINEEKSRRGRKGKEKGRNEGEGEEKKY